jgi:uncharacterized protein YbjT (DUF2867 family)
MARILIVGCGCRGRALATDLVAAGHVVRGTTRDPADTGAIAAAGAEPYVGDPDRIGTLMAALDRVAVACWLLGSATGDPEKVAALHGTRLRFFLEKTVDTMVRGIVYEGVGTVPPAVLAGGVEEVERAHATWTIPVEIVDDPAPGEAGWLAAHRAAIGRLIGE